MIDKFIKKNIERKQAFLQDEHKLILKMAYKNAVEQKCVQGFVFICNISQCMSFTEIIKITKLESQIVLICLKDLESIGFMLNVMQNPHKEYSYAISWLGLKYLELENNKNN